MRTKQTAIGAALAALALLCALFATTASAAPAWKFEGKSLEGTETILGAATESSMTIPGLTTKCENFLYKIKIKNEGGTGKGEVTELPLYNCTTNTKNCVVTAIAAQKLPWAAHLATFSSSNYVVIEGVNVSIEYGNEACVVYETIVNVTGSPGGIVNNATETATFNATTLTTSKTELKALSSKIEANGGLPTEACEWHHEQAISVSCSPRRPA